MSSNDEILERAENMLRSSYRGVKQYESSTGEEKVLGLRNAVTFGRSVTFVLQQLRGEADGFDEWYEERKTVLSDDPVCSRMASLRNEILKEGTDGTSTYAKIDHLNTRDLQRWAPDWADSIFVGDQYGGSGWTVETADGEEIKFYAELPEEVEVEAGMYFPELSDEFGDINDAGDDLRHYVKVLAELVDDAKSEFGEDS